MSDKEKELKVSMFNTLLSSNNLNFSSAESAYQYAYGKEMIDKNGNIIKIWDTVRDIKDAFNLKATSNIINCINGKIKYSLGYSWKAESKYENPTI